MCVTGWRLSVPPRHSVNCLEQEKLTSRLTTSAPLRGCGVHTQPAFETCQDRIDNAAQEANANVEGAAARRQLLSQRQAATAEATHAQLLSNLASLTDMVKGVLREEHGVRT